MTVGEILRQARVRSGSDLDTLARQTRISRRYLEAIEADDPTGVPGQFFYRSFVRQYAEALGLDPADVAHDLPAPPPVAPLRAPIREPEPILNPTPSAARFGARSTTWVSVLTFVAVLAGCSALYAWYHSRQVAPTVVAETPRPVPTAVATSQNPPTPAPQPAATTSTPAQAPPESTPAPNPATGVPVASPDDKVYVVVSSKQRAWVSLVADGKQVFAGTLEPGQVKTMGGKQGAKLRVGNAGGVDVTYNGKPIGSIGDKGQVRTVVFTPQGFRVIKLIMEDDDSGT